MQAVCFVGLSAESARSDELVELVENLYFLQSVFVLDCSGVYKTRQILVERVHSQVAAGLKLRAYLVDLSASNKCGYSGRIVHNLGCWRSSVSCRAGDKRLNDNSFQRGS